MNDGRFIEFADRLERLMEMSQRDPANATLRRQCADAASKLGRFDALIRLADFGLAVNPNDAAALFDKATGLIGLKDYRAAADTLRVVAGLVGKEPGVLMNLGLCHYCLGEFEPAKECLYECYGQGMKTAGLLRLLVSACHHLGLMTEAVQIAGENAATARDDAALAGVYALLYLDADDVAQASKWARTALELNPKSVDGRVTEATLLTARMQTDRARQLLLGVIEDAPTTGRAWIGLGTLDLLAQQIAAAKRNLLRGVELMPTHVGSWHVLGWAQLTSGELNAADDSFQRALDLDRNFSESHGALAAIAAIRGEGHRARQLIQVAHRLDQECLSAKFAEAILAAQSGGAAKSQQIILDTATALAGKDSSALSKLLLKTAKRS